MFVESRDVKLADLKTYSMFYYYHARVWCCFQDLIHTLTLHITTAVASLHSTGLYRITHLNLKFLCSNTHLPNVTMNRLLQEMARRASAMQSVCCMCQTSLTPIKGYQGNDALLKRRWNLNVYLKYIQKEVTVSLSCAGFYNSPFSISHVRKMFLLLVTAQCTIFMYLFHYINAN